MTPLVTAGVVGAVGAGAYLVYDAARARQTPETGVTSLVSQATGVVTQVVAPGQVPAVKVGMPVLLDTAYAHTSLVAQDAPNNTNNNLMGIARLVAKAIGSNMRGTGDVIAAFASCESQNGSLQNRCYNCSLFNIHWTSGCGFPSARVGNELIRSFRTGRASDVEGFEACIADFIAHLNRNCPGAVEAARGRNFDAFQVAIGQSRYSPSYTATVVGGSILPGQNFLYRRYQRLVNAGLL